MDFSAGFQHSRALHVLSSCCPAKLLILSRELVFKTESHTFHCLKMEMGAEGMERGLCWAHSRIRMDIFSPHKKLGMAVWVSVTSELWEAEAGGFLGFAAAHELSSRVSPQFPCLWNQMDRDRAGHLTRAQWICAPFPYTVMHKTHIHRTRSLTHKNPQVNVC